MADKTDWIVEGFQFGTEQDAKLALSEKLRIERLEERMDYDSFDVVYAVYEKAVRNRVFKTPVGYDYLKRLQNILKENPEFEGEIEDIPVQGVYSFRESAGAAVRKITASQIKQKEKPTSKLLAGKIGFGTSVFINVVLLLLIVIMFYISMTSKNPTALNYERAVQNKYSQWEQELSERESIVREKERELLLEE